MHPSINRTPGRFTVTLGDGRAFTLDDASTWDALDTVRDALDWEGRASCVRAAPGAAVNWPPAPSNDLLPLFVAYAGGVKP